MVAVVKKCGLYLHIPFCAYHCHYCSFITFLSSPDRVAKYVEYLIQEIKLCQSSDYLIDTIYFGGGTPSVLSGTQMTQIMQAIVEAFEVERDAEISVEMNPESITKEKLMIYQDLGVNRFSVGAQSFCDDVLTVMGRIHRREDITECIGWMKDLGISNISIDLMFNNPHQTLDVLREDLDQILSLPIDHISIYSLMIESGTQFERWLKKGQIQIADDEVERQMYDLIQEVLKQAGFEQYEISNFARSGKSCRHNLKYWRQEDYLGLGLGASGNLGSVRYDNDDNFIDYYEHLDQHQPPIKNMYHLTDQEREVEYIMLNMRQLRGMSLKAFKEKYGHDFLSKYSRAVKKHEHYGLVEVKGDYISFTDRGLDLANQFYLDLI